MRKAVIIGLDGVSWWILKKLFTRGLMTNLKEIKDVSAFGEHSSVIPPFTVPAWTSVCTGVNPGKHGVFAFQVPRADYTLRTVTSVDVKYPRLHEMLALENLSSVVVNLPLSYPPIILKGIMVSDWLYPKLEVAPKTASEMTEKFVPYDPLWPKRDPEDYVKTMKEGLDGRVQAIKRLFKAEGWRLFFAVFSEPDFLLHKIYDEIISGTGLASQAYEIFEEIDEFIGWVISNVDKETIVIFVSDHGFDSYERTVRLNGLLKNSGLIKFKVVKRKNKVGDRSEKTEKRKVLMPKSVYKILVRRENVRRVLSRIFHSIAGDRVVPSYDTKIDLESTIAYMFHETHFGIYVNSENCFANGKVKKEEEDKVAATIMRILKDFTDQQTGKKVFEKVYLRSEIFVGEFTERMPHVMFLPSKGYWVTAQTWGKLIEVEKRINHNLSGIFVIYSKNGTKAMNIGEVSIYDIVPTVLYYLGLPVPRDSDGRVLYEIFKGRKEKVRLKDYVTKWRILRRIKLSSHKWGTDSDKRKQGVSE